MRKRDVLKLRQGTVVRYGLIGEQRGEVVRVTERGGVLISPLPYDGSPAPSIYERAWNDPGPDDRWLSYSHIHHVE